MDLKSREVKIFKTETTFSLHHINAFDKDSDRIAMNVVAYKEAGAFENVFLKVLTKRTLRNNVKMKPELKIYTRGIWKVMHIHLYNFTQ